MAERGQIVELASRDKRNVGVLVTLVRAQGSSYRKAGARLLVVDGKYAGNISGGCLEAEVVKKAPWAVRSGAIIERYSTALEDTSDIPTGLAAAEQSTFCWSRQERRSSRHCSTRWKNRCAVRRRRSLPCCPAKTRQCYGRWCREAMSFSGAIALKPQPSMRPWLGRSTMPSWNDWRRRNA